MATKQTDPTLAESMKEIESTPNCLAENLGWLLAQSQFALATEINRALAPLGLSKRSWYVLTTATTGEYTQKELADLIGLDKTTMVVTIDELEESGLAVRRPSKRDRRAHVISVTRAGKRKAEEGQTVVDRIQKDVLGTLPPSDRKVFLESLASLVRDRFGDEVRCTPERRREPKA